MNVYLLMQESGDTFEVGEVISVHSTMDKADIQKAQLENDMKIAGYSNKFYIDIWKVA